MLYLRRDEGRREEETCSSAGRGERRGGQSAFTCVEPQDGSWGEGGSEGVDFYIKVCVCVCVGGWVHVHVKEEREEEEEKWNVYVDGKLL